MINETQVEEQPAAPESLPGAIAETEKPANSPDAKSPDTSKGQDEKSPLKSSKAAMEILGKDLPEVAPEDEEADKASEKSAEAKPESAKTEAEKAAPKDEGAEKTEEVEAAKDAPFHKRPEWQALTALGEEAAKKFRPTLRKLLERDVAVNAQLKQAEPDVAEIKSLRQTVGDAESWKFFRRVTEGFASGDPNLIPVLEKMVEQMKSRNGLIVQSPDLKEKLAKIDAAVTALEITPEKAQEWKKELLEIEKMRAGQKLTKAQIEHQKKLDGQRQQDEAVRSNEAALNEWETSVRSKYADFGNVTEETDPQHGVSMADQVASELSARLQAKPPGSQQELVAVAQKALEVVERRMKTFAPQPKSMKPVTSEHSSRTAKPAPKSFKEAADAATGILFGSTA